MQKLMMEPGVTEIILDQRPYGMVGCDELGWALFKTSGKILTNLQCFQELFGQR